MSQSAVDIVGRRGRLVMLDRLLIRKLEFFHLLSVVLCNAHKFVTYFDVFTFQGVSVFFISSLFGANLRKVWKEIVENFVRTSGSHDVRVEASTSIELPQTRSLPRP